MTAGTAAEAASATAPGSCLTVAPVRPAVHSAVRQARDATSRPGPDGFVNRRADSTNRPNTMPTVYPSRAAAKRRTEPSYRAVVRSVVRVVPQPRDGRDGGRFLQTAEGTTAATHNDHTAPRLTPVASRVLVVEDDPTVAEIVQSYLRRAGFAVDYATDGSRALETAERRPPDLVILDLMLPGVDGLEVCRRLRARSPVPVIMLTALGEESDRVLGLEVGADDYVTKPFSPRELVLRVQSVLRRSATVPPQQTSSDRVLRAGDLVVDVAGHRAFRAGQPLTLTSREFDLLAFFLAHPGQAFTRAALMERVWGWSYGDQSTVTVHVRRLREKVEDDPAAPKLLVTVWGVGYRFDPPEARGDVA
jgi:two-component system response regulator ResD